MQPPHNESRARAIARRVIHTVTEPFVDVYVSNLTDRGSRMLMRFIGVCLFVFGIALLVNDWTKHIAPRLQPIPNPVLGYARGVGCDRVQGGQYRMVLGELEYRCTGADFTCAWEKQVPVVYDKFNPRRCRRADRVGRLTLRDAVSFSGDLAPLTFGVFLTFSQLKDPCKVRRTILQYALAACLVLLVAATGWSIANGGDLLRFDDISSTPTPALS